MQEECPSEDCQPVLPFKLARLISNEVVNATEAKGRGAKKEEVTL